MGVALLLVDGKLLWLSLQWCFFLITATWEGGREREREGGRGREREMINDIGV